MVFLLQGFVLRLLLYLILFVLCIAKRSNSDDDVRLVVKDYCHYAVLKVWFVHNHMKLLLALSESLYIFTDVDNVDNA